MKAILLDLDDTLLDNRAAIRAGYEAFVKAHQDKVNSVSHSDPLAAWKSITTRHWRRHEAKEISFVEQRRCRVRDFISQALSDDEADLAIQPYIAAYEAAWKLLPGVTQFLERTLAIPKLIITNGDREQQLSKVRATGLDIHVEGVLTPEDCGYWKPQREIFLHGIKALGVKAEDCLMIGDQDDRDLEPARQLGMECCLLDPERSEQIFLSLELMG